MTTEPPTFHDERAIAAMRRLPKVDYESGLALGAAYADADRDNQHSLASGEAELRAEAREPDSPSWRAFKLGIVRGYRNAVRTFERGRWGT